MVGTNLAMLRQNVQDAMEGTGMIPASLDLVQQLAADEELCQNINSCAQSQSRIADDVLALARINLDMMQFFYVSITKRFFRALVSLKKLIPSAIAFCRPI